MKSREHVAGLLWVSSLQYFIVQIVVAAAWTTDYSLTANYISDLGNTACGVYAGNAVCSPLHAAMNISFMILGLTQLAGALLLWRSWGAARGAKLGLATMVLAGAGTIIVGLAPENTISQLHTFGASLPFIIGNLGLIVLAFTLPDISSRLRVITATTGIVAITALILYATKTYLGIGVGGMERVAAYPQTLWLIAAGLYILRMQQKTTLSGGFLHRRNR